MELPRIRTTLVAWAAVAVVSTAILTVVDGWRGLAVGLTAWLAAGTTLAVALNATRKASLVSGARLAAAVAELTSGLDGLRSEVARGADQRPPVDGRLEDRIEEMATIVGRLAAGDRRR